MSVPKIKSKERRMLQKSNECLNLAALTRCPIKKQFFIDAAANFDWLATRYRTLDVAGISQD